MARRLSARHALAGALAVDITMAGLPAAIGDDDARGRTTSPNDVASVVTVDTPDRAARQKVADLGLDLTEHAGHDYGGGYLKKVGSSGNFVGEKEHVTLEVPDPGRYVLRVVNFASASPTATVTASAFARGKDTVIPATAAAAGRERRQRLRLARSSSHLLGSSRERWPSGHRSFSFVHAPFISDRDRDHRQDVLGK